MTKRREGSMHSAFDGERPVCECHGEPKKWHADNRRKAGGCWVCMVRWREAQARYRNSEKGRARAKARVITDERRAAMRRYWRKVSGSDLPLDSPALSPYEVGRRAALANGSKRTDDAIARYEEKLAEIRERSPHLKELTL